MSKRPNEGDDNPTKKAKTHVVFYQDLEKIDFVNRNLIVNKEDDFVVEFEDDSLVVNEFNLLSEPVKIDKQIEVLPNIKNHYTWFVINNETLSKKISFCKNDSLKFYNKL